MRRTTHRRIRSQHASRVQGFSYSKFSTSLWQVLELSLIRIVQKGEPALARRIEYRITHAILFNAAVLSTCWTCNITDTPSSHAVCAHDPLHCAHERTAT